MVKKIMYNHKNRIVFFTILFFAFVFRLCTLDKYETWSDEKLSVQEANGFLNYNFRDKVPFTFSDLKAHNTIPNVILSNIKGDGGNGILYIVTLHGWSKLFSNSDFAVRFLSVLIGLIVVVVTYYLALELFANKKVALASMLLIAIHPFIITYSQEARAYMLAIFFTLTATLLLFKILHSGAYKWPLYVCYTLAVTCSILSHYSTVYIFLAHVIICLCHKLSIKKWFTLAIYVSLSVTLVILWMVAYGHKGLSIIAMRNAEYMQLSEKDPANAFYMATSIHSIVAGWLQNLLYTSGNTLIQLGLHIKQVAILLVIPFTVILAGFKNATKKELRLLSLLFILALISLFYATLLALKAGHIISFQQLYSLFSAPYFIILMGYGIIAITDNKVNKQLKYGLIAAQLAIMLFSTSLVYQGFDTTSRAKNEFEAAAHKITNIATGDTAASFSIVYNSPITAMEVNKYFSPILNNKIQLVKSSVSDTAIYLQYAQSAVLIMK